MTEHLQVEAGRAAAELSARLDRLPVWGLRRGFFALLGMSYFFAFYDISAIGVNLTPMLADLHLPASAAGPPVTWSLIAYIVGSYAFGTLADLTGRRAALRYSILVLALGSLLTALSWNLWSVTLFRVITGLGIGAQIAIAATMAGEFANRATRGRYVAANAVWGALAFVVTPFVGLLLLPLPHLGWRIVFALGALSVLVLPFTTDRWLPESPRWLAARGRVREAEAIVARMEAGARARTGHELPPAQLAAAAPLAGTVAMRLLLSGRYLPRLLLVFGFWFLWYLWIYGFLGFGPALLSGLGLSLPHGLLASGLGNLGFLAGGLLAPWLVDRMERKAIVCGGAVIAALGFVVLANATPATAVLGGLIVGFGNFAAISAAYTYTGEIFPATARASAMAVGDGLGHLGGALAPFLVLPLLAGAGPRAAFWGLAGVALASAVVILAGRRTTNRPLDELI